MNKLQFKTVGYLSFKTKRVYKTIGAKKASELSYTNKLKQKTDQLLQQAKKELQMLSKGVKEIYQNIKPSFSRWSYLQTIKQIIKEVIREIPKSVRHLAY